MEERLRRFAQVIDYGGFSKAAQALHLSQPALTTAIKKLERELGAILVERGTRQLVMTPAGELAYQAARELDTQAFNLRQRLLELSQARPVVRLGMIDSLADTLAGETNGFAGLQQTTDLSVVVDNSRQLILDVAKELLEAAIIVRSDEPLSTGIAFEAVGAEPLLLVVHPTEHHRYQEALRHGQLPNFLSYNHGSHTQQLIDGVLLEQKIATEPTFYSTSPEIMLKMVLLRQGAAILPYALVKPRLLEQTVVAVSPQPAVFSRPLCAIYYQGRRLPGALSQVFTTADAALRQLTAEAGRTLI
jgi:DNA-binding transcriptional LysR family regulator